ncbi:glycogen [starch] synthase-like [Symsagittifera roscoffensis]|uniref:glycogen [starch] synthase-like n=1 Tax=Symsagittifera roscoffensis TaxID=84072 RepID=UPI00307B4031
MSVSPRGLTHRIKRGSRPQLIEDELDICRNVNFDNRYVFEVSWEVVNKVGGIYTVLKTKTGHMVEQLGDRYLLIGPYNESQVQLEVEVEDQPDTPELAATVRSMRERGVKVVYGRWLVEGYPRVILFDIGSQAYRVDEWKTEFYNVSHIGVPYYDREAMDALILGSLVAWFIGEFKSQCRLYAESTQASGSSPGAVGDRLVVAQFHEWLAGVGVVLCRTRPIDCATIFTTHATLLGRYLCAGKCDFYNNLGHFDVDREAGDRQIYHRYCIERAAAHAAHAFTTVSDVTGLEAQHLLKRSPDILTPNGMNVIQFSALHEFQNLHAKAKEKIHDFVRGHFYGHYTFDLDQTIYMFTAGRYEFSNKGADMFLEALARLNYMLKSTGSKTTVVAFMIFPAKTNNFNVDSLKGQAVVKQLKETVSHIQSTIGEKLFESCLRGKVPDGKELLTQNELVQLKRCIYSTSRPNLPPICTHNMTDDFNDPILSTLRKVHLFNDDSDRVKVIFHPEFLSSTSPLLSMDYDQFVRGCHLGVFPSYYEPWGYTPAECTVMGVPSITTNLSGFGSFVEKHITDSASYGIFIVDRMFKHPEESQAQLSQFMFDFCRLTRRQRIVLRNRTERLSELLDWKSLGLYYVKAQELAAKNFKPEIFSDLMSPGAMTPLAKSFSAMTSPASSKNTSPNSSDDEEETELTFYTASESKQEGESPSQPSPNKTISASSISENLIRLTVNNTATPTSSPKPSTSN